MPQELQNQFHHAAAVQEKYGEQIMRLPNVVGLGLGFASQSGDSTTEPALIVMVTHKEEESSFDPRNLIPTRLDGVRVDVQEWGVFAAF